jgi:hypothetical protein
MKSKKLFSKREKEDKSTSMGKESEVKNGGTVVSKNPSQKPETENKEGNGKKEKVNGKNEKGNKTNENVVQKVDDTTLVNPVNLKDLQAETRKLQNTIKKLEESISKERNEIINETQEKDYIQAEQNQEIKKITKEYKKNLELLKSYDKILSEKEVKLKKNKKDKNEEELKKEISLVESQVKKFEDRAGQAKENYNKYIRKYETKENQESKLQENLNYLNDELSELNNVVKDLKKMELDHKRCKINIRRLKEEYELAESKLKKAQKYALSKNDVIDEDKNNDENMEEGDDSEEKAESDEKNLLPKIQNIKFNVNPDNSAALEWKIIKKNKLGLRTNRSSIINVYSKLNTEFDIQERDENEKKKKEKYKEIYEIQMKNKKNKNKNKDKKSLDNAVKIRNKSYSNIKTEGNYLFKEKENKLLQKLLPSSLNLVDKYQNKFNEMEKQKKEIEKKYNEEINGINKQKFLLNNQNDFNALKMRESNQRQNLLNIKYHKLREKIRILKNQIKDVEDAISKEDKKIKVKDKEAKRLKIYYDGMRQAQEGIKVKVNET